MSRRKQEFSNSHHIFKLHEVADIMQENRLTVKSTVGHRDECVWVPGCQQHTVDLGPYLVFVLFGLRICLAAGSDTLVTGILQFQTMSLNDNSPIHLIGHYDGPDVKTIMGVNLQWGWEKIVNLLKNYNLSQRSSSSLYFSLEQSYCVCRQNYKDSGRGFTRPAWAQMKPNTQSVSLTMPENQAAHVCSERQQWLYRCQ